MADVFTELKNALASASGLSADISGIILGTSLAIVLLIALQWIVGESGKSKVSFIVSATLGIVISTLVGWYPVWVIVFMAIVVVFSIFKPFGGKEETA